MDTATLTALVTVLTPFITQLIKQGLEKVVDFLPVSVKIILPIIIGIVLQSVGSGVMGTTDPMTASALGAMAGGLGASGRDLIHKRSD